MMKARGNGLNLSNLLYLSVNVLSASSTNWGHFPDPNWNLEVLVFEERGKTGVPGEKPLVARTRTNNKLNPHMTPSPGIEPGPHWWETSALTTAPSLLPCLHTVCI